MGNNRLRQALGAAGLTRQQVAEQLQVDPKTVDRWIREGRTPHPRHRYAIVALVDEPEVELWPETEVPADSKLDAEAELFDTMELARLASSSGIGSGTMDATCEAVDLLCRAYPTTHAAMLRERSTARLAWVLGLLDKRLSLKEHREVLVAAGWLAALVGCVEFDLARREHAEAARQAANQLAHEAAHSHLAGWAQEISAWFALVEGKWEDAIGAAQGGQSVAGTSSAGVQLHLQEATGFARLGASRSAHKALDRSAAVLGKLPNPVHAEHHFVFDHTKWSFYAATIHGILGEDRHAEEHARAVIAQHLRPDGSSNAPMRVANSRIDLAIVYARRGDLEGAVVEGMGAFDSDRFQLPRHLKRADELAGVLQRRWPRERLTEEFHELLLARRDN